MVVAQNITPSAVLTVTALELRSPTRVSMQLPLYIHSIDKINNKTVNIHTFVISSWMLLHKHILFLFQLIEYYPTDSWPNITPFSCISLAQTKMCGFISRSSSGDYFLQSQLADFITCVESHLSSHFVSTLCTTSIYFLCMYSSPYPYNFR